MGHSIRRFGSLFALASLCLGMALGLLVLRLAPGVPGWSRYRLVLTGLMGVAFFGALVAGDIRRVLLLSLAFAIPLL